MKLPVTWCVHIYRLPGISIYGAINKCTCALIGLFSQWLTLSISSSVNHCWTSES